MISILAASTLVLFPPQDDVAADSRGWAIRCAVAAYRARESAEIGAELARSDGDEPMAVSFDRGVERAEKVYQAALAAPFDVPTGAERFALASQFGDWANSLDKSALAAVLTACEVALSQPTTAP